MGDVKFATIVGGIIMFVQTISIGNIIATMILSALGAIASYLATTSVKWLIRKIKLKINQKNKFHSPN